MTDEEIRRTYETRPHWRDYWCLITHARHHADTRDELARACGAPFAGVECGKCGRKLDAPTLARMTVR